MICNADKNSSAFIYEILIYQSNKCVFTRDQTCDDRSDGDYIILYKYRQIAHTNIYIQKSLLTVIYSKLSDYDFLLFRLDLVALNRSTSRE